MVVQIKAMTAGAQDVAGHRSSMSHPSRPSAGSLSTLSFSSTGARVSWPTLPAALLISYASTLPARLTHNPNSRHFLPAIIFIDEISSIAPKREEVCAAEEPAKSAGS